MSRLKENMAKLNTAAGFTTEILRSIQFSTLSIPLLYYIPALLRKLKDIHEEKWMTIIEAFKKVVETGYNFVPTKSVSLSIPVSVKENASLPVATYCWTYH
ncbi:hypothetical protein RCL_jg18532.t1 [Rhizophagus clarus]|uniref:Uncharacterized protein n=1 Tax=Rhizophagus clarus TaxID=94130 RepID=A0A8H3LDD6_9GLOM|nr:hypothetical protein RCL_jg18532.t1 [Rhizophagus clarus]